MDFITGLPRTSRGNDSSVRVVVDRLTKMAKFIATKKTVKTSELAKLFVQHLYKLYGMPADIVSHRDRKFNSHFWRKVFKKLDTTLSMSTADHPESDGQTERINQILEDMLRSYVSKKQSNWEDYLPILEFAYKSSKDLASGFTPFMLMYGFHPRSPMAVSLEKEKTQSVKDFLEDMNDMLKAARENIRSAQDHAQTYANKARKKVIFEKEKESPKENVELPHMQSGGLIKDVEEAHAQLVNMTTKSSQLQVEYPLGLESAIVPYIGPKE
ncbi:hypothetical protein L7F22_020616 [Adiantum nelumboides]|nr:hypothetical protein [Adiantum nelumboides]